MCISELKQFKIIVYLIIPGKRVRTHCQEHPYGVHIFTASLFFINPNMCLENSVHTFLCPFCAYAMFMHEAPELESNLFMMVISWSKMVLGG